MPAEAGTEIQVRQDGAVALAGAGDADSGRWGQVFAAGTAVIAGLAAVLYQTRPALAAGNCGTPCCDLASCTRVCQPNGKPLGWNCPAGYFRTSWTCVWGGTHHALCGECSKGTNCFAGPWACSIWFNIN